MKEFVLNILRQLNELAWMSGEQFSDLYRTKLLVIATVFFAIVLVLKLLVQRRRATNS